MTRARILADYVAGGTTATEFDHMDGVTSNVQTQLDAKAPKAGPTFTGTVAIPNVANLETAVVANTAKVTNSTNASDLASGTIADARMPNLTGDVTTVEGAVATTIAASVIGVKPHIIPDVLYPAVGGKLLDGSTSHGSTYGVAQADGYSYYYTDIKGSKPIKDPRIGAHFGSQRHKFKSRQLLEQETATHGSNVYSIDGREWIRQADPSNGNANNNNDGTPFQTVGGDNDFWEVTGYFNEINWIGYTYPHSTYGFKWALNGSAYTTNNTASNSFNTTVETPLKDRYVDAGSLLNIPISASLGIHTFKFGSTSVSHYGCELIAQDTTSTATKSQIQIPSQNVVSYGKKFTVSGTPHYNPFAFAGDGTTAVAIGVTTSHGKVATGWAGSTSAYFDSTLDTATSLGLSAWEKGGDYWRPVNGGRIVKWVDSSGNIKTSVNMIPPASTSIGVAGGTNEPDARNWTTAYEPSFYSTTIDHSQAEVAKTFMAREFGNGAANGGTGATYADASMVYATDDIAYVMDDGLTSFSMHDARGSFNAGSSTEFFYGNTVDSGSYLTFIGTGISVIPRKSGGLGPSTTFAQNLPYGTHVLKVFTDASTHITTKVTIDGVQVYNASADIEYGGVSEFTFHQPKMPPIPEDAVVIADYMLMADYVANSSTTANDAGLISKGIRLQSATRDIFYDRSGGSWYEPAQPHNNYSGNTPTGLSIQGSNITSGHFQLPYFGHSKGGLNTLDRSDLCDLATNVSIDGGAFGTSNVTISGVHPSSGNTYTPAEGSAEYGIMNWVKSDGTLGANQIKFVATNVDSSDDWFYVGSLEIASPIHTSSHYQTFETPFLHELVGGDRNMEQTNLVVTPDGKTWDEVTRDTSYIGKTVIQMYTDNGADTYIWDIARGSLYNSGRVYQKDFAIAYDRLICLKSMECKIHFHDRGNFSGDTHKILVNGQAIQTASSSLDDNWTHSSIEIIISLKRGDYVQAYLKDAQNINSSQWGNFHIIRLN